MTRLATIWTMPACGVREKLRRTREELLIQAAHHMPRPLAHRVYYDVLARYTWAHPQAEVPAILAMDVTKDFPMCEAK